MKRKVFLVAFAALAVVLVSSGVALPAQEPAKVAGKWEITWQGRQGPVTATLELKQKGEELTGKFITAPGRESPVTGTVKGKEIAFTVVRETQGRKIPVRYTGSVEGDAMKGTVPFGQSTREWTAKRLK